MVWRSRPGGAVGYTLPAIVLEDSEEFAVLFQPSRTVCKQRTGRRGGSRGRTMIQWDGGHADRVNEGPSTARLHVFGTSFEVLRSWTGSRYVGWYINLVTPWKRTRLGFDTRDLVLDMVCEPDLSGWRWKDEEEVVWAVEHGRINQAESDRIYSLGREALRIIEAGTFPIAGDWAAFSPEPTWPIPQLPPDWSTVH